MIVGYISGQKLELVAPTVVSDTINYLTTKFIFDGEAWTTLDKFVFFTKGDETYCLPLDEDRTKSEDGLNLPDGVWMVNVVGLKYDEDMHIQTQITTTACPITVSKAVAVDGPGFPDIPESVAHRIMEIIGDMESLDTTEKDNLVAAINEVLHGERDTQTDYDENDETSPAYMKNRPFYEIPWEYTYSRSLTMSDLSAGPGPYNPDFRTAAYRILGDAPDLALGAGFDVTVTITDQDGGLHAWVDLNDMPKTLTADDLPVHTQYIGRKGITIGRNDLRIVITDNGYFLVERCPFEAGTTLSVMHIKCRESAVHTKLKLIDEKFLPEIDYDKLKNKPSIPTTETVTEWGFAKQESVDEKQDTLVSGENIKTLNGESILGSGDIEIISENADYAENDSTKPSYIENRPFYEYQYIDGYDHTFPASETTWTGWTAGGVFQLLGNPCTLNPDRTYLFVVTLGTMPYQTQTKPKKLTLSDVSGHPEYVDHYGLVLNAGAVKMVFVGDTMEIVAYTTVTRTLTSIRIYDKETRTVDEIKKLDKKFLPDIDYSDIENTPEIPPEVTDETVYGWGYAKRSELPPVVTEQTVTDWGFAKKTDIPTAEIDETKRSLDKLWKLNEGISYEFETAADESYTKQIPTGAKEMDIHSIGGKSIVWNQIINEQYYFNDTERGGLTSDVTNHKITISGTTVAGCNFYLSRNHLFPIYKGHKYLVSGIKKLTGMVFLFRDPNKAVYAFATTNINRDGVYEAVNDGTFNAYLNIGSTGASVDVEIIPQLFDLTQMFGAGNEPTAEEFEVMFPADYYTYSEPTLVSADVNKVVGNGRNLIDDTNEIFPKTHNGVTFTKEKDGTIIANGTSVGYSFVSIGNVKLNKGVSYRMTHASIRIMRIVDGKRVVIQNSLAPFSVTANMDCFVEISLDINKTYTGYKVKAMVIVDGSNTEYVPYRAPITIPIPEAIRNLPGYGWSAGSVYNEVDFVNKRYIQRVGSVDCGTLDWKKEVLSIENNYYSALVPEAKPSTNVICTIYNSDRKNVAPNNAWISGTGNLNIAAIDYETASEFKIAMSGVMLYYEFAESIVTDISDLLDDAFENIEVEAVGSITFEQTDDSKHLPVPNEEEYLISLAEVKV